MWLPTPPAHEYIGFDYDIKVGINAQEALNNPTPETMLQLGTLAKRIDAVAFINPSTVDLIEIKATHLAAAYGQLLLYKDLWTKTYPTITIRRLIIITQRIDDETLSILNRANIAVYTVTQEST
jgi:hypothetical protein